MEEGPEESVEPEEEEVAEAPPRKGRRTLIVVAAIVIVVALVAGIVVYLLFANSPPQPAFIATPVDLHLVVNAEPTTDPDGDSISNYSWNWGDGSPIVSGARLVHTAHDYAAVGKYTVTLSVIDSHGLGASTSQSITIVILPTPYFIARQSAMTTTFDATGSFATPGKTITTYQWTFGDGLSDNTGPTTTHTYSQPGRYNVTLAVTDSGSTNNSVSRWVSANTTTVDILANQFFVSGCPYGDWWNLRFHTYGDVLPGPSNTLRSCTDFYPWVLYSEAHADINPSWVYTLLRMDMQATHNLGYNVAQPVVLPVFNYSASPGSYVYYNFTFDYLGSKAIAHWDNTSWPVNQKYSDGFGYLVRGNITMDLQESRRIFDVGASVPFGPTANFTSQWNATANGYNSDDSYAWDHVNGNISQYGNYGIPQLPANVQKVQLGLEGYTSGDDKVGLAFSTDGGSTWQDVGTVSLTSSDTTQYVDITSLRSWTTGLLSNANFRTRIQYVQVGGTADKVYVDWVPVLVKTDSPSWWWAGSTKPTGVQSGPLERAMGAWLDQLGNGKYDIYNAFQWYYESDIADLNATVNSTTGQTKVGVFFDGWGWDVLMSRWFYWGNTSYQSAVNAPYGQYAPRGWMPFETCWCENATVNLTIRSGMDVHMAATSEYWFGAVGNPGPDGVVGTGDDLAGWSFSPTLMDYMPQAGSGLQGASQYPNSELKWYNALTQTVNTPGSFAYGQQFEYMTVPSRWNTSLGNTLTLELPRGEVPWYDPVKSAWNPTEALGDYTTFMSRMTLRSVTPSGDYYRWDERGKVLSIAWAPGFVWQNTNQLPRDSSPSIEFAPETTG